MSFISFAASSSSTGTRDLRALRELGALDLDLGLAERVAHGREVAGSVTTSKTSSSSTMSSAPASIADHQVVLVIAVGVDHDHALLVEQVGDGAGLAEDAAVLAEQVADVGAGPVAVVGQRLDQQRDAAGTVALVEHRLDLIGIDPLAGALRDRALDVVLRHRGVARLLDRQGRATGCRWGRLPPPARRP